MAADMQALRAYVTAPSSGIQNRDSESTVLLHVTHSNLKAVFMELRFDMHITIGSLKEKLMTHVGTNASSMSLSLKAPDKQLMFASLEDSRMLGYYSPVDGCIVHVTDNDPFSLSAQGGLEDLSKVQKYEMSDADYNARENTYRKFKEQKLLEDPNWSFYGEIAKRTGQSLEPKVEKVTDENYMHEFVEGIQVGLRCEVSPGARRGWVRYVGKQPMKVSKSDNSGEEGMNPGDDASVAQEVGASEKAVLPLGWWVGVEYDEPLGKNNGTVKGVKFFTCAENFGAMIRPDKVTVGDFPPLADDLFNSDDEL